jgi:hypothetical protein
MNSTARETFVLRLLSVVCVAFELPLAWFAGDVVWRRIPAFESIFTDFGVAALPAATELFLHVPWLPFAVTLIAIACGVVSYLSARRWVTAVAWCLAIIGFYCVFAAQVALHEPLLHLIQALSSGSGA